MANGNILGLYVQNICNKDHLVQQKVLTKGDKLSTAILSVLKIFHFFAIRDIQLAPFLFGSSDASLGKCISMENKRRN